MGRTISGISIKKSSQIPQMSADKKWVKTLSL